MRAMVTGGHGFVGRHLVAHLEERGDDVAAIDRHDADVTDRRALEALFATHRPEVVYHLAAVSHVQESWADPATVLRVNVEGTLAVLGAASASGISRALIVGSAEEYGSGAPDDVPLSESTELRPTTPYGASKVAASFVALQAHLAGDIDVIRTRSFNHIGPGQSARFFVPGLAARVAVAERDDGSTIAIGSLHPVRDLTDVRDVVRAYRLLIAHGTPGEVYNVCRGAGNSVEEIAAAMLSLSTRALELEVDPDLVRAVDNPVLVGDPTRLVDTTGWRPEIALEQSLADVLAEARARA